MSREVSLDRGVPSGVKTLDYGCGSEGETLPSHVLTAHESTGSVLHADLGDAEAVTILTQDISGDGVVALPWNVIKGELSPGQEENLRRERNNRLNQDVKEVEAETCEDFRRHQEIMKEAWGFDSVEHPEIIPTYEFAAKSETGNLMLQESGGTGAIAYMWPDMNRPDTIYSHAVGVEDRHSGVGYETKMRQRKLAEDHGFGKIRWTVDPLNPGNNRLNLSKLGATVVEYREDKYDTETSGGAAADRFVIEWELDSERSNNRERAVSGSEDYAPDIGEGDIETVLEAGGGPIVCTDPAEAADSEYLGVEVPRDRASNMERETAEEWREATRAVLSGLMQNGYRVTELMTESDEGFDQNTYLLERV